MMPRSVTLAVAWFPPLLAGIACEVTRQSGDRFDLDSTASTYPFVTRLQGTMTTMGDSLVVLVDSGMITSRIAPQLEDEGTARDVHIALAHLARRFGHALGEQRQAVELHGLRVEHLLGDPHRDRPLVGQELLGELRRLGAALARLLERPRRHH